MLLPVTICIAAKNLVICYMGEPYTPSVCEITFDTWADTLSGHNKIYTDTSGVVWTSC